MTVTELQGLSELLPAVIDLEGLNVAVLQQALDKLDSHQNQARAKLFNVLKRSTVSHAAAAAGRTTAPTALAMSQQHAALDAALGALCDSAATALPDTPEATLAPVVQQYRTLATQAHQLSCELNRQRATADLMAQVAEFDRHMQQGQFSDAAWCTLRLQRIVEDSQLPVEGQEGGGLTEEGIQQLRDSCAVCTARLTQAFDQCMSAVLVVEAGQRCVLAQRSPTVTDAGGRSFALSEVLAAMEVVGVRTKYLHQLAGVVLTQVVAPLLRGPPCHVDVVAPASPGTAAALRWQPMSAGGVANSKDTADQACRQVLKLLGQHLLGLETDAVTAFGAVFWRQLSDDYLKLAAGPALAAHAEDVEACERVVEAAQDLEAYAEGLGFLEEPYLGPAVEAAARIALSGRQEAYLLDARRLLVEQSHEAAPVSVGRTIPVDEDYLLRLHAGSLQRWEAEDPPCGCSTSGAPWAAGAYKVEHSFAALVSLVERALGDACASGNRAVARALRGAVCSIALMARTLPGATGEAGRLAVPQLALLHYNGLRHLADALLLLPACYGPSLEALLGEPLTFLEEALLLRQAARQVLAEQLSAQERALGELLDGLQGLYRSGSSSTAAQVGIAHRKTVRQVQHSLSRLGAVLMDVLTPGDVVTVTVALLGAVCTRLVNDILAKRDIGIDESKEMADVLQPVVDDALHLLLAMPLTSLPPTKQSPTERCLSGVPKQQLYDAALARCQAVRKLRSVLLILQAKMSQVVMQWQRRRLQADGLDAEEVQHLIVALFQDSEKRREALAHIAQ